jgi:hypothetical protein
MTNVSPVALFSGNVPVPNLGEGWFGPRASLDGEEIFCLHRASNPVRRYIDCDIPVRRFVASTNVGVATCGPNSAQQQRKAVRSERSNIPIAVLTDRQS